eukprot:CAMPEP_0178390230 /NCGR_PEP_ID=MMETSP0689_2-20121128/10538_1 /TAXON_ID=160604 /ORGANISM="Amphidinium massartii, Strain CS-259" /LENGTH=363 /DNA_ID=CAMNT_0020010731 /DNA_START=10 /DNA_END=1101 /DNA_ORIENTATION=+
MAAANEGVTVVGLGGDVVVQVFPPPGTVAELKLAIEEANGVPPAQQQLVHGGDLLEPDNELDPHIPLYTLVVDERPLSTWDIANNPDSKQLSGEDGHVHFAQAATDYVLVLTQAPVRAGRHFFEFTMHRIGDEQWCGVVTDSTRAGHGCGEAIYNYRNKDRKPGWFYYCGRRAVFAFLEPLEAEGGEEPGNRDQTWHRGHDGCASLHAGGERNAVKLFRSVNDGDVIGMLLDVDLGALVFLCNGEVQGGCEIPKHVPLYLSTCVDRLDDHVELRKLPLDSVPQPAIEALTSALHPMPKDIPHEKSGSESSPCSTASTPSWVCPDFDEELMLEEQSSACSSASNEGTPVHHQDDVDQELRVHAI